MMQHRSGDHHPLHLFDSNVDRLSTDDRDRLQGMLDHQLGLLSCHKQELNLKTISKKEFNALAKEMSESLRCELQLALEDMEFVSECWCLIHEKNCPVTPRMDPELEAFYWVEGAGTICKPFSSMSTNPPWCDPSTLSTLTWAYSIRFFEPDEIQQECVSNFHHQVFFEIFGKVDCAIKNPWAKPLPENAPYRGYESRMQNFSPTDLGVPTERCRKYCNFKLHWSPGTPMSFEDLFYRRMVACPSMFCVAPDTIHKIEIMEIEPRVQKKVRSQQFTDDSSTAGLGDGGYYRLEDYRRLAIANGLLDPSTNTWNVPIAICNLMQNPRMGYGRVHTHEFPAILQQSNLFDLVNEKPITVAEMWLVQGFPRPGLPGIPDALCQQFPYGSLIASTHEEMSRENKLPLRVQKSTIGNSMHKAQIGHWIMATIM